MSSFKPDLLSKPGAFSIIVPGVSPQAALVSEQLMSRNHKEFDIFFNEIGFHNHLIHHLLAAYSLGASKEKIQEIFDTHAKEQRPIPPSVLEVDHENLQNHLGNRDLYTSFLNFFKSEIEKNGMLDTVRRFVWSGDMLARTMGGLYHPMIHIGYGLEFDIPGIAAEGLAMAACTEDRFVKLIPNLPEVQTTGLLPVKVPAHADNAKNEVIQLAERLPDNLGLPNKACSPPLTADGNEVVDSETSNIPAYLKGNTVFPILEMVRKDPIFNGLMNIIEENVNNPERFDIFSEKEAAMERIKHYVSQWSLQENTKDIQAKFKDLYTTIAIAVGSSGLRKDHPGVLRLDFFLMHALTSSEFLHQYISKVAPSESIALLRGHLTATLFYFIAVGSPEFNLEGLFSYKSPTNDVNSNNNWLKTFDKALACKEAHVIKVVRACAVAQVIYGPNEDPCLNAVWLQVAQMAIDKDGDWDFDGVGFDQSWKKK